METSAPLSHALAKPATATAVAAFVGAMALIAPVLALLALAALGARALMQARLDAIDWPGLAGPLLASILVGAFVGLPGAIGTLFAWRLWSDARWSVNEARRLARAAARPSETTAAALAHAWATPLYGLALVAFTAPHLVAGLPLDLPAVPQLAPVALGLLALATVFDWALRRAADWRLGELAPAPAAHLAAHHLVFFVAFGAGLDVSAGLCALIAWRLAHAAPLRATQASLTAVP